jgi:hypothetical protein
MIEDHHSTCVRPAKKRRREGECSSFWIPEFKTQAAFRQHVQNIVARHGTGKVCRLEADEESFVLRMIVAHHPNGEEKVKSLRSGLSHVEVRRPPGHSNHCFYLVGNNGIEAVDISWTKVLKLRESYDHNAAMAAARKAVEDTIATFRLACDTVTCEICACSMVGMKTHVDHSTPQFHDIFNAWVKAATRDLSTTEDVDGVGRRFTSAVTEASFRQYHDAVCVLRLVHERCNLQRKRT